MSGLIQTASSCLDDCEIVTVESVFLRGYSGLQMLGGGAEVCRGGLERARCALEGLGISLPPRKILLNLAPAQPRREGAHFDLALAVSLALLTAGKTSKVDVSKWLFAGELALSGGLRPVKGIVSFILAAVTAGLEGVVIPYDNFVDARILESVSSDGVKQIKVLPFESLSSVLAWVLDGKKQACPVVKDTLKSGGSFSLPNFDDMILSQDLEQLACTVAAGGHSVLLHGSPGTGKSMFAERLPSIWPSICDRDHLEVLRVHSIAALEMAMKMAYENLEEEIIRKLMLFGLRPPIL